MEIKAKIYITKTGNETIRKIYIYIDEAEFSREFYSKKTLKNMIDYLKNKKLNILYNMQIIIAVIWIYHSKNK